MSLLAEITYAAFLFDLKVYFLVFGAITLFGGIMGYVKAHSIPSLVAGGIAGLLLILGALMIPAGWQTGLAIDLLVSLALAGRFFPSLLRGKYNPAIYIVPLAIIGAVLAALVLTRIVVVHV